MHETNPIEEDLRQEAERIGKKYPGAPVVIIVGGSSEAKVSRCMTGTNMHGQDDRLRDLEGILETAKQIEAMKHFGLFNLK